MDYHVGGISGGVQRLSPSGIYSRDLGSNCLITKIALNTVPSHEDIDRFSMSGTKKPFCLCLECKTELQGDVERLFNEKIPKKEGVEAIFEFKNGETAIYIWSHAEQLHGRQYMLDLLKTLSSEEMGSSRIPQEVKREVKQRLNSFLDREKLEEWSDDFNSSEIEEELQLCFEPSPPGAETEVTEEDTEFYW